MAEPPSRAASDDLSKPCLNHATGHSPHWMQALHSMHLGETPPEDAFLIKAKRDGTIIVDIHGTRRLFWNHEPARLALMAGRNQGRVTVQESWSLLRTASSDGMYCFSISDPGKTGMRECQIYRRPGQRTSEVVASVPELVEVCLIGPTPSLTPSPVADPHDARDCPRCGVGGILPLDQDAGEDMDLGFYNNPVLICPICDEVFRSTATVWTGEWRSTFAI